MGHRRESDVEYDCGNLTSGYFYGLNSIFPWVILSVSLVLLRVLFIT